MLDKEMIAPVECAHCGMVYDLTAVKPTARFADATCFKTPCCDRYADDRTWKSMPDFTTLEPGEVGKPLVCMMTGEVIRRRVVRADH